jgi:ketosteroid isomerase-like protein
MSQEYVETVRAVYERYREGDFRTSAHLLDPRVTLVLAHASDWGPETPEAGIYVGAKAVAAYTRDYLLNPWEDFRMKAEELVEAGDSVLVRVLQSGVGRTSRAPAELRYFTLWSFRGPKVIRIESFRDRATALKAAGLSE